jgi:hypothetical protein
MPTGACEIHPLELQGRRVVLWTADCRGVGNLQTMWLGGRGGLYCHLSLRFPFSHFVSIILLPFFLVHYCYSIICSTKITQLQSLRHVLSVCLNLNFVVFPPNQLHLQKNWRNGLSLNFLLSPYSTVWNPWYFWNVTTEVSFQACSCPHRSDPYTDFGTINHSNYSCHLCCSNVFSLLSTLEDSTSGLLAACDCMGPCDWFELSCDTYLSLLGQKV